MILSATLPNLSTLDTESLNGFLEQSQQQGLTDLRMIQQISENVKYLIVTKLKSNPVPGYNAAQNADWERNIPVNELLMHCKSMVTHGKQTNDAIVQTSLKQINLKLV